MLLLSRLIIVCLGKQNRKMRLRSDVRDQRQIQLHSLTQERKRGGEGAGCCIIDIFRVFI